MDRPWKAPLAQKLIRPSSCTFRISVPGTWLRHAVQRFHASSCAGVFFTVEQATMRKATRVDIGVRMNARRMVTGVTSSARLNGEGGIFSPMALAVLWFMTSSYLETPVRGPTFLARANLVGTPRRNVLGGCPARRKPIRYILPVCCASAPSGVARSMHSCQRGTYDGRRPVVPVGCLP